MSFRIERGQMIPIQNRKDNKVKQTETLDFQQLLQESIKNNDSEADLKRLDPLTDVIESVK